MTDELAPSQLRAADVFLYHGDSFISRAIRLFDGTEVNHAGLYSGPPADSVTEALAGGVRTRTRTESVAGSSYVLVYRHKTAPDSMDPVSAVAARLVEQGVKYGYEQIVLLALLALTRRVRPTPFFGAFLRKVLDAASAKLVDWVEDATGRRSMICSEVVFRCYDEALEDARDAFTIEVDGVNTLPAGLVAPFAAERGTPRVRRPEPGSVLDVLGRPGLGAFTGAAAESARPSRPAAVPDEREISEAGERYLDSLRSPVAPRAHFAAVAQDAALDEALRRFAVAFRAASMEGPAAASFSVGGALEYLYRNAAAFVTPGDLYKSRSLMRLGLAPAK